MGQFLAWCEARGLALEAVSPLHVAAYIRTHPGSAPTVKQHLAAIRMLGDWLVVSQVLPVNPAAAVRGPKHVVTKGATPVLSPAEARRLLDAIDTGTLAGLRDRALVSVMLYCFARVSAVIGMRRHDYFRQESRGWLRLHEKGGKRHDVPAHHRAAEALDDYLEAAGLAEPKAPLFQSVDPAGRRLTGRALSRRLVVSRREHARAHPCVFGPPARPDPGAGAPRCVLSGGPPVDIRAAFSFGVVGKGDPVDGRGADEVLGTCIQREGGDPDRGGRAGVFGLEPDGTGAHGVRAVTVAVLVVNGNLDTADGFQPASYSGALG